MDGIKIEKERFEYLFLDIEWNQAPGTTGMDGREAIQIGAVAADAKMQKVKTFSKAIRLSDPDLFNEKTAFISHYPLVNIMRSKEEKEVLSSFAQCFPQYRYIVVWTRNTYDLFVRDMKKCGILIKRHKAVILQEVVGVIAGRGNDPIGFESALLCAGIEYVPNYLHYAKHDVNYLYQLFCQCYRQYSEITAEEHCIANEVTRRLHTENCRYVKNMPLERMVKVKPNAMFHGFKVCKCCGGNQIWKRLEWEHESKRKVQNKKYRYDLKRLPLTDTNIEKICEWFQLAYNISNDTVFVRTAFSGWIVYLRGDKVKKLLHENYRIRRSRYFKKPRTKCTEGYHRQKLPSENFFEVIKYIKNHDAGIVNRMSKKSRVEELLEMVEMELKMKKTEGKDYGYGNMSELQQVQ